MNHDLQDELDLLKLLKVLRNNIKKIIIIVSGFLLLSIFVVVFSEKTYVAETIIFVQTEEGGNSGAGKLGGLASLAGVNLPSQSNSGIPPTLYPKIVSSFLFKKELVDQTITPTLIDNKVSYREYFQDVHEPSLMAIISDYTLGLPSKLISFIKKSDSKEDVHVSEDSLQIYSMTKEEFELFGFIDSQLSVILDEKEGFIKLSFEMPEPLIAAEMAFAAKKLLEESVINFKIIKAKEQLLFIKNRYELKKTEYDKIKLELAEFKDKNKAITSAKAQNELLSLQTRYDIANQVYLDFASQLEQAQNQVAKDTPIFLEIQPVVVPFKKSKPRTIFVIFTFIFVGLVSATSYFLVKELILKKQYA